MTMKSVAAALTLGLLLPAIAHAEASQHQHPQLHGMQANDAPSSKAFEEASARMHKNMTTGFTGDADVDFVQGMIPHHQGAIDMARIQLQYGKDPTIRKMAEAIIVAQEAEISQMKQWLKQNGK